MKYRRVITVCGFAFALVLCALSLGGCDLLFPEDPPPELIIKNESFDNITSVEFWDAATLAKYEMTASELAQNPPLLKDTTVIPYEGFRSWTLDTGTSYIARINDKLFPVFLSDTEDTVYVFNGMYLTKKRHDYRSAAREMPR
jgi:hypothetical protein